MICIEGLLIVSIGIIVGILFGLILLVFFVGTFAPSIVGRFLPEMKAPEKLDAGEIDPAA